MDGAIVEVENAYKKLQLWNDGGRPGDFHKVRLEALMEVGPSVFFSLLVIAVAFLPVFTLVDQEGRLFKPLAYSKNLAMAIAAFLAITLDPALRMLFARMDPFQFRPRWVALDRQPRWPSGRYYAEEKHPISVLLHRLYEPPCRAVLRHPKTTIAVALVAPRPRRCPVYLKLGSEFMPPLYEGSILYMPTTLPGISVTEAERLLQVQDKILKSFPEVERVFGKAGRADTSTDPAPFSMMETTVILKPESEWRPEGALVLLLGPGVARVGLPARLARPHLPRRAGRRDGPGAQDPGVHERLDDADQGAHRHALDRRPDADRHQGLRRRPRRDREDRRGGRERRPDGARPPGRPSPSASPAATSSTSTSKRDELARYGLTVDDANDVIMTAIGGEPSRPSSRGASATRSTLRYPRELREDLARLERVLVPTMAGAQVPLGQLARHPARPRAGDDPERERPPLGLRLRRLRHRQGGRRAASSRRRRRSSPRR